MSSAILPRRLGGHNLAMPSWTIVPMLYHKPPDYNMRRTVRPVDWDDKSEDRELLQEDDYGTVWKIKSVCTDRSHIHACLSSFLNGATSCQGY